MADVYITGSSITCALAEDKKSSIKKLNSINNDNYKEYLRENFEDISFYRIKQTFKTQREKFFTILKNNILDAIKESNLSSSDIKQLQVYLASTSMNIALLEENFLDSGSIYTICFDEISDFIENLLELKYPCVSIQTACTSGVNAMIKASESIKNAYVKKAMVVGFEFFNNSTFSGFNSLMLISPSGEYKPFDKYSDGLILGEACSCVVLEDHKKNSDDFRIISYASTFDDYSITSSNPEATATLECMKITLEKADLKIEDLTCLKAHATGSENSNLSEAKAIDKLFKLYNKKCDVVVLKPYIGHTLGSCGTNEIVLLTQSIKNGILPKTINFKEGYENIDFTPSLEDKSVDKATILFHFVGFGGSNTSIILSNKEI